MIINASTAVTDNDFINHLAETNLPEDELIDNINGAFSRLKLKAVVHPLVFDKEMKPLKSMVRKFYSKKVFEKAEFTDIHQNSQNKKIYYSNVVKEGLKFFNGTDYKDIDVFKFWAYNKSFGEVHSTAMCLTCGCQMFLSDDGDSIKLAEAIKNKFNVDIQVYNREKFLKKHKEEGKTIITSKVRKRLSHKRCN